MKTNATATVKGDLPRFVPSWEHIKLAFIVVVILLLVGSLSLYISHLHHQQKLHDLMIDADRNYDVLPFDMMDAERYCRLTVTRRFGDQLLQNYVDEHSSRHDDASGLFKVFMIAHIGTNQEYEREAVHCFVDPERRVMTHFRTINLKKASLMSRATKFFD